MATPTILFNSGTGSDTAASGAGPGTALFGTGASLNGTTTVTLSADTPDLSGVATDGSAVLWVDTTSGRQYSRITAVDNGADTVTVATAYGVTEATRNWGIGGKRATLDHADSRTLGADIEEGWIVEIETDGAAAITGTAWPLSAAVACIIRGNSTSTKRLLTQSANAAGILVSGAAAVVDVHNLIFENTNGTKTAAAGISVSATNTVRCDNCRFGHATNTLLNAINRTAGSPLLCLNDCEVMFCTGAGISARTYVQMHGCYVHDNASHGVAVLAAGTAIVVCGSIIETNGGDGINIASAISTVNIVSGNTIHGNTGDGLDVSAGTSSILSAIIHSNNFTANGGYGIRAAASSNPEFLDYNNFGTGALANTSGSMLNLTAGAHDLAVDPGYADAANGNFAAGTAIKALGFPDSTLHLGSNPTNGTYAFNDVGIQRAEAGGGGVMTLGGMTGGNQRT